MCKNNVTIMIISTIPDMFGEHYYFIKDVLPELREICRSHDINLEYRDLFFSMSEEEFNKCRSVKKYFNTMDSDRTFYICFRGQKLGCVPTPADIDKMTLDEYPELVDYIGDTSFTELTVMHALHPFEKYDQGDVQSLPPVKHSLFYFRNDNYINDLSSSQKEIYTCGRCDEEFVHDLKLAMAKDLVFHDKREFEKSKDKISSINIRRYDGIWSDDIVLNDVLEKYIEEYLDITGVSSDDLPDYYDKVPVLNSKGCFYDFKFEGQSLKDIIIEDFINELKIEFPQNF